MDILGLWVLDGKKPVKVDNLIEWGQFFRINEDRTVNKTIIGKIRISTVFLGVDHQFNEGEPLLFETMIFGGKYDNYQWRYSTWEQAEEGHQKAVKRVQSYKLWRLLVIGCMIIAPFIIKFILMI